MRKHFTPATAISLAALFFSLTGAGMGAGHYLITSTSQIKPSVRQQLRGKQGPRGLRGLVGPAGTPGVAGAASASTLSVVTEVSQDIVLPATGYSTVRANCPAGYSALSGGYSNAYGPLGTIDILASDQFGGNTWEMQANGGGQTGQTFIVQVVCGAINP
jgi:hypothetical protein